MVRTPRRRSILQSLLWVSSLAAIVIALFGLSSSVQAAVDIKGVDVSHYQGAINWTSVKNAGYSFSFMKATEGTTYTDPTFATNIANATSAGVYVGPYHFCRLDTNSSNPSAEGASEANYFLSKIKPYYQAGQYLPPVADVERFPTGLTTAQLKTLTSTWVQSFSDTIYNSIGVRPIIYNSLSKANSYYTTSVAGSHELWLAWWKGTGTTSPPVASDTPAWGIWEFWQWSDGADSIAQANPVPGISANVDRDVYYGTLAQLKNLRFGNDHAKPGDFNRDGIVNTADYNLWLSTNGQTVPIYSGADGNGDAKVNSADYAIWLAHAVPEPGSITLILAGLCAVALRSRRSRRIAANFF